MSSSLSVISLLLVWLVPLLLLLPTAEAVICFCTDDHCNPYGKCEGSVCLVGIVRDSNQVIRTCGNRALGCHREDDDKWTDLCACDQPFCNTLTYLRAHTRDMGAPPEADPVRSAHRRDEEEMMSDEPGIVFHRMDRPDDAPPPDHEAPISTRTSLLTLLLVVVPLTVGGATILVRIWHSDPSPFLI